MLLSALVFGLLGSLHCLGMCGPIALMLPLQGSAAQKGLQVFAYHFGRTTAYVILGITFGLLGKGLYLFGLQQNLSIAMGGLMVILVLIPASWRHKIGLTGPLARLLQGLKNRLGVLLKKPGIDTLASLGFLNGFLPCGLVYMALVGAVAMGDPWQGGLYMALFGLGTAPLMSVLIFTRQWVGNRARGVFRKSIPVFVFLIGLLFIVRGLGLGIPYISPKAAAAVHQEATIDCHQP